jgi:hypothetical protein
MGETGAWGLVMGIRVVDALVKQILELERCLDEENSNCRCL